MRPPRLRAFGNALICCAAVLGFLPPASHALTGTVVNEQGETIKGAQVCYVTTDVELLCSKTTDSGFWSLPDSRLRRIRAEAPDHLPQELPAVQRDTPIVLRPAATLWVKVVDANSGEGLDKARGQIVYPSGRWRGFVTNKVGARVRTLEPGKVRVTGSAEGYLPGEPLRVVLVAGKEIRAEIPLRPEPAVSPVSEGN